MADAQNELQIRRKNSIVAWNPICRGIVVQNFINNPVQIGGPRHIGEMGESLFSKRKFNRGKIAPEQ